MSWGFEVGQTYNRRKDIHAHFGGQQQGGIITPKDHRLIICITGESGEQYGYSDGWKDGVFQYFGEGQKGDMEFVRGNSAIKDQVETGRDLLVFQKTNTGELRFMGEFVCAGYDWTTSQDVDGNNRKAIVFNLVPIETLQDTAQPQESAAKPKIGNEDLSKLREIAIGKGADKAAEPKQALQLVRKRSQVVKDYVLARARGKCELCDEKAPLKKEWRALSGTTSHSTPQ